MDPGITKSQVISAIKDLRWDLDEWRALRVAANLWDRRSETPESYLAFLKRSKVQFWTPESVLFWQLLLVTQRFHQSHQPGPGSF